MSYVIVFPLVGGVGLVEEEFLRVLKGGKGGEGGREGRKQY